MTERIQYTCHYRRIPLLSQRRLMHLRVEHSSQKHSRLCIRTNEPSLPGLIHDAVIQARVRINIKADSHLHRNNMGTRNTHCCYVWQCLRCEPSLRLISHAEAKRYFGLSERHLRRLPAWILYDQQTALAELGLANADVPESM